MARDRCGCAPSAARQRAVVIGQVALLPARLGVTEQIQVRTRAREA
jgi:hypothetical protein